MVGLVIVLLVIAVAGGFFAGYKYGAEDLAKVKAEVAKIESEILSSSVVVKAEHVIERVKAIF
jgi:hypothetical protein